MALMQAPWKRHEDSSRECGTRSDATGCCIKTFLVRNTSHIHSSEWNSGSTWIRTAVGCVRAGESFTPLLGLWQFQALHCHHAHPEALQAEPQNCLRTLSILDGKKNSSCWNFTAS